MQDLKETTWIDTVRAITNTLKASQPDLTGSEVKNAIRILTACCLAIDPERTNLEEVKSMLESVSGRYQHIARDIADAILDAPIPEGQRTLLYGAFRMAEAFLYDLA